MRIRICRRPKTHQYVQGNVRMVPFLVKEGHNQRQHPCTSDKVFCQFLVVRCQLHIDNDTNLKKMLCDSKMGHSKGNVAIETMDKLSVRLSAPVPYLAC